MKYFIRAFFGTWKEVNKEQYEDFKKSILDGALAIDKNNAEEVREFLNEHCREVA